MSNMTSSILKMFEIHGYESSLGINEGVRKKFHQNWLNGFEINSWEGIWTDRALSDQAFFTFNFDLYMPKINKIIWSKFVFYI